MKKIVLSAFIFCLALTTVYGGSPEASIKVFVSKQRLFLYRNNELIKEYPISTSKFGIGNQLGSNKTPLGKHRVARKIGDKAALNMIFKNRASLGRLSAINYLEKPSLDDRITSRILRLEGLERGVNKGGRVDSFHREIYIHGTPDEGLIGRPASHGCIRMKNQDVVELFDAAEVGTLVTIYP